MMMVVMMMNMMMIVSVSYPQNCSGLSGFARQLDPRLHGQSGPQWQTGVLWHQPAWTFLCLLPGALLHTRIQTQSHSGDQHEERWTNGKPGHHLEHQAVDENCSVCFRAGVPPEYESGAGCDESAEPSESVPPICCPHVCCHHQVSRWRLLSYRPAVWGRNRDRSVREKLVFKVK